MLIYWRVCPFFTLAYWGKKTCTTASENVLLIPPWVDVVFEPLCIPVTHIVFESADRSAVWSCLFLACYSHEWIYIYICMYMYIYILICIHIYIYEYKCVGDAHWQCPSTLNQGLQDPSRPRVSHLAEESPGTEGSKGRSPWWHNGLPWSDWNCIPHIHKT